MTLVLASASPRRRALLTAAGIAHEVDVADVDERRHDGESPGDYAQRVALEKAVLVSARRPGEIVLAADTIVVVDGDVLGKPGDDQEACAMLERLSGRAHDVLTAVALVDGSGREVALERTQVWMRGLSPAEVTAYVRSGEPRDKAGAYGIQGLASRFITRIDGSYTNVVGLPVATVDALLRRRGHGADSTRSWADSG